LNLFEFCTVANGTPLSGEVKLNNLQLKKEALDKFDLPIDVVRGRVAHLETVVLKVDTDMRDSFLGHLGELTLSIPWSNLKTKPVQVYIKDVYVLAVPRNESTVS
jgi:vacuolar protein sorting-associated protein 13A/C